MCKQIWQGISTQLGKMARDLQWFGSVFLALCSSLPEHREKERSLSDVQRYAFCMVNLIDTESCLQLFGASRLCEFVCWLRHQEGFAESERKSGFLCVSARIATCENATQRYPRSLPNPSLPSRCSHAHGGLFLSNRTKTLIKLPVALQLYLLWLDRGPSSGLLSIFPWEKRRVWFPFRKEQFGSCLKNKTSPEKMS